MKAAGVPPEAAVALDDPVAGQKQGNGIFPVGVAHRAARVGTFPGARQPGVAAGFTVGNRRQLVPYLSLKRRPSEHIERDIEGFELAFQIQTELIGRRFQPLRVFFGCDIEGSLQKSDVGCFTGNFGLDMNQSLTGSRQPYHPPGAGHHGIIQGVDSERLGGYRKHWGISRFMIGSRSRTGKREPILT